MSDIPFNMKAERIASTCNLCKGSGEIAKPDLVKWCSFDGYCFKCKGHGKIVVATRYVCDVKEPFPKAKD